MKGTVIGGELTIKNVPGKGPDEHYIKEVRRVSKNEINDMVVFPDIFDSNDVWLDYETPCITKYLGVQRA